MGKYIHIKANNSYNVVTESLRHVLVHLNLACSNSLTVDHFFNFPPNPIK